MDFKAQILSQLVSIAVAALCGWLGGALKSRTSRDKALEEGVRAVLRRELVNDYEAYALNGVPLSVERKEEIARCYEAYALLGGNWVGKQMHDELQKVRPFVFRSK